MGKDVNYIIGTRINKALFVSILVAMRNQQDFDKEFSSSLEDIFGIDSCPLYDNSLLTGQLVKTLHTIFPDKHHSSMIDRFCHELDFGRVDGSDVKSPSHLWDIIIDSIEKGIESDKAVESQDKDEDYLDKCSRLGIELDINSEDSRNSFIGLLCSFLNEQVESSEDRKSESTVPAKAVKLMSKINKSLIKLQELVNLEEINLDDSQIVSVINFVVSRKEN